MNRYSITQIVLLWLSTILLVSCAQKPQLTTQYPMALETAVRALTTRLLEQVKNQGTGLLGLSQTRIVLDPFRDKNSGEVVKVSRKIEQIIEDEVGKNFSHFVIEDMTPQNLVGAHYVMNGVINFTMYEMAGNTKNERFYQVSSSIVDLKTAKIIANSDSWISEKDLDYTPTSIYKDSPIYLKDKQIEGQMTTAQNAAGESAEKEYYDTLDTHSLLIEAENIYEQEDYRQALTLFDKAATRDDGQVMRTYAGLYESHYKLKDIPAAEAAFSQLLAVSIKESRKLNVKLLFAVNSTDFIDDQDLRNQYALWLRQITKHFDSHDFCFEVIGHSSHSGPARYNKTLSLSRAKKVQELMAVDFADIQQWSKAVGKGFTENVVGSGTDDARDAIDRRVEFLIVDCAAFQASKQRATVKKDKTDDGGRN